MTARSDRSNARPRPTWTPTRTIQALAALCVGLAIMCLALALLWSRQHEAAQCWRAAAEYHLHPEACGAKPESASGAR
jgi:hypothetical protein